MSGNKKPEMGTLTTAPEGLIVVSRDRAKKFLLERVQMDEAIRKEALEDKADLVLEMPVEDFAALMVDFAREIFVAGGAVQIGTIPNPDKGAPQA